MDIQIVVHKKAFIGVAESKRDPVKLPNIRYLKSVFIKPIRQALCLPSFINIITQQPAVRIFFCEQKIGGALKRKRLRFPTALVILLTLLMVRLTDLPVLLKRLTLRKIVSA